MTRFRRLSAAVCLACTGLNAGLQVSQIGLLARVVGVAAIDWVGMRAAFADPAANGQALGSGLIGSALGAVSNPQNQASVGNLNPMAGTSQMQNATSQYSLYLDPNTDSTIPDWAAAQNAVLTNPVCNNAGWAAVSGAITQNMLPAAQNAQTTCQSAAQSIQAQMSAQGGGTIFGSAPYSAAQSLATTASSLLGIAKRIESISANVPSCNLVNPTQAMNVVNSVTTTANNLITGCSSAAVGVTPASAGAIATQSANLSTQVQGLTQNSDYKQAVALWQYGVNYAANTSNGKITMGSLMGTPNAPSPSGGLSSVVGLGGSPVTAYLNDPKNQQLLSGFMGFVRGTATQISNSFSSCGAAQTAYATTSNGSASAPASQTVNASSTANPSACPMPTHAASSMVLDPSAVWIFGNAAGDCAQAPGNATLFTYVNNSYSTPMTFTFMLDGSYTGATMDGGTITNGQSVTMAPGIHTIQVAATGPVVAAGMNGQSVVFDTSTGWGVQLASSATNGGFGAMAPTSVTYPLPSAQQDTVMCKAAIQCLGTQCHSIMSTQDQTFGQAMSGLSALQQMQENAQCAPGTSIAMGNCAPILFQGNVNTCRTFPGGGWLTNDCCNNPVKTPLLSTVLKIATSVYTVGAASGVGSTVMSDAKNWLGSAYQNTSGWFSTQFNGVISAAGQAWSTVSAPFKSAAQSWSNAFGGGGPGAVTGVAGLIGTAQPSSGSGGSTSSGSGGPSSGGGSAVAGSVNVIGSLASVLGNGGIAPIAAQLATNLLGPNVAGMLFGTTVTGGSAFVAGTAPSSSTLVTAGPSVGTAGPAQGGSAATATMGIIGTVLMVYAIYQIVVLIAHLITSCKDEEFQFKQYRDLKECFWIGSYCATKVLGLCLETKWVGCCYPSPLIRIIAQQIVFGQPGVIPGVPGTAQSPSCAGLTPDQLAKVDWSKISLQEWIEMLVHGGMMPTTNTQGANTYTTQNSSHPTGVPNPVTAAQQGAQAVLPAP